MSIIVVTDIFGKTDKLVELSNELGATVIIDPYDGKEMNFKDESEAYSYFIEQVGHDAYLSSLLKLVNSSPICILVGFSIGATAIWRLSQVVGSSYVKYAYCFYGSQIRNYVDIMPKFNINLILPKSEAHFDVSKLQDTLSKKNNINIIRVEYLHGFMNFHSDNYNKKAYTKYKDLLKSL